MLAACGLNPRLQSLRNTHILLNVRTLRKLLYFVHGFSSTQPVHAELFVLYFCNDFISKKFYKLE